MHLACQFSLRWHQQFARALQLPAHRHCFPHLRSVRCYRQKTGTRKPLSTTNPRNNDLVVREYEQAGGTGRNTLAWGPKREIEAQAKYLRGQIKELERELAGMRQGPFGSNTEFMKSIPVEERERLLKALEEEGLLHEDDDSLDLDEVDTLLDEADSEGEVGDSVHTPSITLRIPQRQKAYVKRFNEAVKKTVESDQALDDRVALWKWYLRCQQHVMGFSSIVPEDVWQILWTSQTQIFYRPEHVVMLAKDMLAAKVKLTGLQWVTYIRALREVGDVATAVTTWEELRSTIGPDPELASEYYILGIDLFSDLGRPHTAQDLATECLENSTAISPRIYIPLILAWAKSRDSKAAENAWVCYLKLRHALGNRMTADIYADLSSKLLASGRRDMALAIFKDLMLALGPSKYDSMSLFNQLSRPGECAQAKDLSAEKIDQAALQALLAFPKALNNKYFFGAWIKQLIGSGNVDGAADVVELMYERGVPLDAKHLNGVVGAWLREGSKASQKKAEHLAWAMVHRRVQVVQQRRKDIDSSIDIHQPSQDLLRHQRNVPHFLRRAAPPANIETFSILILHYTRRSDTVTAEYLTQLMVGPAQISPNSYIMNHWLYAALRDKDIDTVWNKYSSLKESIQPDLETFAALWDTAKVQYDPARSARGMTFPAARKLFEEMRQWLAGLTEKDRARAREEFSSELYSQIIRCFCLQADLAGTLCALHPLRDLFGEYPSENTKQTIVYQVARMLPRAGPRRRFRTRFRMEEERRALLQVAEILESIQDTRRVQMAARNGMTVEESQHMSEEMENQLRFEVLNEFLLEIIDRLATTEKETALDSVKAAAASMSVNLEDIDLTVLQSRSGHVAEVEHQDQPVKEAEAGHGQDRPSGGESAENAR